MKRLFPILAIYVFLGFTSCNQKITVPDMVLSSFAEMFPAAEDVEWEQEDELEWEVEFEIENTEMSACFSSTGEWIETETELEVDMLPKYIVKAFEKSYEGYEIEEAEWVESIEFSGYELEAVKGSSEMDVYMDQAGNIFKIESVEEDDE